MLTSTASLAGTVTAASSGAPITGAATTLADGRDEVVGASVIGSEQRPDIGPKARTESEISVAGISEGIGGDARMAESPL